MRKSQLTDILKNGENSSVEFKRDDVHADQLAKEISALLNLDGGRIFIGVQDDGSVSGLRRSAFSAEEWIMNICRNNIQPAMIPHWQTIRWDDKTTVGIISLPEESPDKPYKAKRCAAWVTFVRVGTTSREATREEEARLYQSARLMRYDIKPVPGTDITHLESRRLTHYIVDILGETTIPENEDELEKILVNLDILIPDREKNATSVAGLLLFGETPKRFLPHAGITATAYPETEKDYNTTDEENIKGPIVSLFDRHQRIVETGVIDQTVNFVLRNMGTRAHLEGGRRLRTPAYPEAAVRETITNAVAHRDYTITATDIELSLYSDRLEVISPGRLPNTVTVEKMKQGYRAARNELLKEILRDYGYVEHRGMGVRRKIIQGMQAHNGTMPDLVETADRFMVRLWKEEARPARNG